MKKEEEELITLITAVAAAALGYKVKINKINFLCPVHESKKSGWTMMGRMQNLNSHNPIKR